MCVRARACVRVCICIAASRAIAHGRAHMQKAHACKKHKQKNAVQKNTVSVACMSLIPTRNKAQARNYLLITAPTIDHGSYFLSDVDFSLLR